MENGKGKQKGFLPKPDDDTYRQQKGKRRQKGSGLLPKPDGVQHNGATFCAQSGKGKQRGFLPQLDDGACRQQRGTGPQKGFFVRWV